MPIQYQFPQAAVLFLGLLLLLGLFWGLEQWKRKATLLLCGPTLASSLTRPTSLLLMRTEAALFMLSWMLAVLALMGPFIPHSLSSSPSLPRQKKPHAVLFLVDASASMSVEDSRNGQSRLSFAKQIAEETISHLHGESVGLYAFTSQLVPLVPPTWDHLFVRLALRHLSLNEEETAGTDFFQSLDSLRAAQWAEPRGRTITLVLLSDGGDTELDSLKGDARKKRLQAITQLVADQEALQVLTVGLGGSHAQQIPGVQDQGKPVLSALEQELLLALSASQGAYFEANSSSSSQLGEQIATRIAQNAVYFTPLSSAGERTSQPRLLFSFPLACAMIALVLALLCPHWGRRWA